MLNSISKRHCHDTRFILFLLITVRILSRERPWSPYTKILLFSFFIKTPWSRVEEHCIEHLFILGGRSITQPGLTYRTTQHAVLQPGAIWPVLSFNRKTGLNSRSKDLIQQTQVYKITYTLQDNMPDVLTELNIHAWLRGRELSRSEGGYKVP